MTQEEFANLTREELRILPQEEFLKHCVRFTEERYIWYKKQLEWVFKDKEVWPPGEEFTEWYKELLREGKNREESDLKEIREELTYHRQGLNPPFCYPEYWKDKKMYVGTFGKKGSPYTLKEDLNKILFKSE